MGPLARAPEQKKQYLGRRGRSRFDDLAASMARVRVVELGVDTEHRLRRAPFAHRAGDAASVAVLDDQRGTCAAVDLAPDSVHVLHARVVLSRVPGRRRLQL